MRPLLLSVLLVPACFNPPGLDPEDSASTAGPLTSGSTDEPMPSTTDVTPTTTLADTTTVTTTAPPDTGEPDPTGAASLDTTTGETTSTAGKDTVDATDDTGDTGDTDATGEPVAGCWDQGSGGWPLEGVELMFIAEYAFDPFITADGLELLYMGGDPRRPFSSIAPGVGEPFPEGTKLALWKTFMIQPSRPRLTQGGAELLLALEGDIVVSGLSLDPEDSYTVPQPLVGVNDPGRDDGFPTATADGAVLIVQRDDGPAIGALPKTWSFHQHTRVEPSPGAAFGGDAVVTPFVAPHGLAVCPTLSPDGLRLFFTSTEVVELTGETVDGAVDIYYTTRPSVDAAWELPLKIPALDGGTGATCPTSVTADGCALTYIRVPLLRPADEPRMFLARRIP